MSQPVQLIANHSGRYGVEIRGLLEELSSPRMMLMAAPLLARWRRRHLLAPQRDLAAKDALVVGLGVDVKVILTPPCIFCMENLY